VWLVDGPAVQHEDLAGRYVARIDVNGRPALVQAFEDPHVVRGTPRSPEDPAHSYRVEATGVIEIDVPFEAGESVDDITVRVADLGQMRRRPVDQSALAQLFDDLPHALRIRATITAADLQAHPDFVELAPTVGLPARSDAGFEIYRDRAARYRWRLRRPDGRIVADSGQGYLSRQECEADLRWIRGAASDAPIRALDLR